MKKCSNKIFLISQELPNEGNLASTTVVRKLIEQLNPIDLSIMGFSGKKRKETLYSTIRLPRVPSRGERFFRFLFLPWMVIIGTLTVVRRKINVIVVTFPDDINLLAGYLIHKITGISIFPYFFDLYVETGVWKSGLDKWLQPRLFNSAKVFFVINEGMQDYYTVNYGHTTVVIPFCISVQPMKAKKFPKSKQWKIAFSGSINAARISGLRQLVSLLDLDEEFTICYLTPHDKNFLKKLGIWRERFRCENVTSTSKLIEKLKNCDLLYLPVSDDSSIHIDQLKSSFGAKNIEYLESGVPILVNAPSYFFTYKFFEKRKAALLCSLENQEELTKMLTRIKSDKALYQSVVNNALESVSYFNANNVSRKFIKHLN